MIVQKPPFRSFLVQGRDIQIFGMLLLLAGTLDLVWIASLPSLCTQGFWNNIQRMGRRICEIPTPVYPLGIGIWFFEKKLMGILGLLYSILVSAASVS